MQVIDRLQGIIERTYDLENGHRLTDFLVTCPDFARGFGFPAGGAGGTERVLVSQEAGEMYFVGSGGGNWSALYEMADFASETSNPNYGFWSNPEWFDRWRSLADIRDPQQEREVVLQMLEVFYNDPPWLMLYMQPDFYGVSDRLDWQPLRDERVITLSAKLK